MLSLKNLRRVGQAMTGFALLAPSAAFASGSSMPWEAPLNDILTSITGPVAKVVSVIVIVGTGITLAVGDTQGGTKKLLQIAFGLSTAFAATTFFLPLFGFAGGATF